jgi:hypothetical protein
MEIGFITIDCADALAQIDFWAKALGYDVNEGIYVTLRDPKAKGPSLYFQEVPEPRTAKNRVHIDLLSERLEDDRARLVELGATHVKDMSENNLSWMIMEDPEGNVFCVFDVGAESEPDQPTV